MGKLERNVSVVTGASSGIGRDLAVLLAREGCKVVLCARNLEKLNLVADEIKKFGGDVIVVKADIGDYNDIDNLIETVINKFSRIDILVNNAGYGIYGNFHIAPFDEMEKLIRVNFLGSAYAIYRVIPFMISQGGGTIVNISSVVGKRGVPGMAIYSASKFALTGLTEALRVEYKKYGIHFISVHPGSTKTKFFDNAKYFGGARNQGKLNMMSSEKVAKAILKAIVKRKRDITLTAIGRAMIYVNKFAPSIVDYLMSKIVKITD
jgi:short-subunit dehydrogenase